MRTFDLHGITTVRGPAALDAHLAPFAVPAGEPDLTVAECAVGRPRGRWTSGLSVLDAGPVLVDGAGRCATADPVSWAAPGAVVRVDHGFDPAMLWSRVVLPALRVRLLRARRIVPVRAAAFRVEGLTIAVAGWTGTGKTRLLLEALGRGASFIGDDWVLVDADGRIWPVDVEMHVADEALADLVVPASVRRAAAARRTAARAMRAAGAKLGRLPRARQGLWWLADVPSQTAWVRGRVDAFVPGARLAGPGRIDVLWTTGPADDVPRRLGACARFESARDREAMRCALGTVAARVLDECDAMEQDTLALLTTSVPVVAVDPALGLEDALRRSRAHVPATVA